MSDDTPTPDKPRAQLVTTGPAADAAGVHPNTLWRWWKDGLVQAAAMTAGGQTRWDIEDLLRQIDELQAERAQRRGAQTGHGQVEPLEGDKPPPASTSRFETMSQAM